MGIRVQDIRHVVIDQRVVNSNRPPLQRDSTCEPFPNRDVEGRKIVAILDRFVADSGIVARELSLGGLAIDAARVRCPVLVQAAAEDRFFPPAVERRIAERYGAALRVYERHAHFVVMEPGWEEIAGDAERWLAAL